MMNQFNWNCTLKQTVSGYWYFAARMESRSGRRNDGKCQFIATEFELQFGRLHWHRLRYVINKFNFLFLFLKYHFVHMDAYLICLFIRITRYTGLLWPPCPFFTFVVDSLFRDESITKIIKILCVYTCVYISVGKIHNVAKCQYNKKRGNTYKYSGHVPSLTFCHRWIDTTLTLECHLFYSEFSISSSSPIIQLIPTITQMRHRSLINHSPLID